MLGRLYAVIFICAVIVALWYQRKFLESSAKELNTQLTFENSVLSTSTAMNFQNFSYENGRLKYSFSGNKITYFTDNHFEAEGNLVYEAFDTEEKKTITIKTDKAFGQIDANKQNDSQNDTLPIATNSRIKNATLPGDVFFDFDGNVGKANQVFIDMENEFISSKKPFTSNGPQGNLKGNGFKYSIPEEEFRINSNVNGDVKLKESKN
ncbi:LPS export ABC transporter periplasmic protein LptC [Pigmentibacter sp. JX0631]|uniref:LPS export ABC transporter periplasmic protein LptC n=1 Tax=Pigmentibacter sp. JX0631 TaxID=2976982 RepID=UPI0024698564|nr:LPS export ABC transporter periplasmic protein LptC [Pigmentibacter sp. JX0631]WGL58725.1 LPS export ABC transporter periplasmic protein LptC [Pigmentibacter sp. JX0631]